MERRAWHNGIVCCRRADGCARQRKAFRALLRAKLSILHLRDEAVRDREAWRPLALDYLWLAGTYAERLI